MSPRHRYRTWSLLSPSIVSILNNTGAQVECCSDAKVYQNQAGLTIAVFLQPWRARCTWRTILKISVAIIHGGVRNRPIADFLARSFFLLLVFGLSVACRSASEEPAVPIATPVSATLAAPTSMAAVLLPAEVSNASIPSTGTVSISSFVLPLSEDWSYLLLDEATYRDELLHTADVDIALQTAVTDLFTNRTKPPQLLVAWPHNNQQKIGLLAYVLPLPDMTLQRYLAAVEAQLPTVSSLTLREAETLYSLRDDRPVGYIQYSIATAKQGTFQGHHYALFNNNATELLVLTFIAKSEVLVAEEELQLIFAALMQDVHFNSAPVE